MKAVICDRCGETVRFSGHTLTGSALGMDLSKTGRGYYPAGIDLCDKCLKSFQKLFIAWWREEGYNPDK